MVFGGSVFGPPSALPCGAFLARLAQQKLRFRMGRPSKTLLARSRAQERKKPENAAKTTPENVPKTAKNEARKGYPKKGCLLRAQEAQIGPEAPRISRNLPQAPRFPSPKGSLKCPNRSANLDIDDAARAPTKHSCSCNAMIKETHHAAEGGTLCLFWPIFIRVQPGARMIFVK